jgi:G3E family GTPase
MEAVLLFSDKEHAVSANGVLQPEKKLRELRLAAGESRFGIHLEEAGNYALFTQHHPDEFQAKLRGANGALQPALTREYKPDHEHDEEVSSVGITTPGDLDEKRLNAWLRELLTTKGTDIFRMKGVLSIKNQEKRFVFQGVHMLFDGQPDRPWGAEERRNALIFIGRKLDRAKLNEGFRACLA